MIHYLLTETILQLGDTDICEKFVSIGTKAKILYIEMKHGLMLSYKIEELERYNDHLSVANMEGWPHNR